MRLNTFFWGSLFAEFGKLSKVTGRIFVYFPQNIIVKRGTTINEGAVLNARGQIIIGSNVHVSSGAILDTSGLIFKQDPKERAHFQKPITICDGVWIGLGAIVLPGVTIGKNSVLGAGAVASKNIPDNEIWGGVPAKFIKDVPAFEKRPRNTGARAPRQGH